jgi:hypothetical protein
MRLNTIHLARLCTSERYDWKFRVHDCSILPCAGLTGYDRSNNGALRSGYNFHQQLSCSIIVPNATMSTLKYDGLANLLKQLSISTDSSMIESTKLLANPLDVLRASLAELLVKIVDCQAEDANKSIQWPNDLSNGDLSVTLPRLRPGCKPKDLSSEVVNKVGSFLLCTTP